MVLIKCDSCGVSWPQMMTAVVPRRRLNRYDLGDNSSQVRYRCMMCSDDRKAHAMRKRTPKVRYVTDPRPDNLCALESDTDVRPGSLVVAWNIGYRRWQPERVGDRLDERRYLIAELVRGDALYDANGTETTRIPASERFAWCE
jgi:hypothetical protein